MTDGPAVPAAAVPATASGATAPAASGVTVAGVPAVSVIMAVYNGMAYAEAALRSVLAQTLHEIEIIVVDDASTDGTPDLLARLAAEDPRIVVAVQPANAGPAAARNRAIGLARAPYVAVLDADDLAMPERLAVQKDWLDRHPGAVMVAAGMRQIDAAGRVIRVSRRDRDAAGVRWLARFNMPLVHPTVMFRRPGPDAAPLLYDPALRVAQDFDFVARALPRGDVVSLPDVLVDYRIHGASLSSTKWRDQQAVAARVALRVQTADLPAAIVAALAPFRAAYFGMERVAPAAVFAGLRAMLAHDRAAFPGHAAWMRRQAAQIAEAALTRGGAGRAAVIRAFVGPGRDFLPALALRLLEIRRLLPAALRSEPVA